MHDSDGAEHWGWTDLPLADAAARLAELRRVRDEAGLKFAVDFRPHSHHHVAMQQVRQAPTESGVVDVGGARACVFMTSWGDGLFPLYRDLSADGRVVRVRADLGCDEIVKRQRRYEEWWFGDFAKLALVSRRVLEEGAAVGYLYREQPSHGNDSGWCVSRGDESQEYMDDEANLTMVPLRELIERDRELEELFRAPPGAEFHRPFPAGGFVPLERPPSSQEDA